MKKTYLEDYTLGERFVSPARTITETDIVNFSGLTSDWHPLHTDITYAEKSRFGQRIAHGMLVLSVGMAQLFRISPSTVLAEQFIAFYGMDKVRFIKPTYIGDTIKAHAEVIEVTPKQADAGVLRYAVELSNQRDETICAFDMKFFVERRPNA